MMQLKELLQTSTTFIQKQEKLNRYKNKQQTVSKASQIIESSHPKPPKALRPYSVTFRVFCKFWIIRSVKYLQENIID